MTKLLAISLLFLTIAACERNAGSETSVPSSDSRFMTVVSNEVIVDSEPTLDENLDRAFEIVRAVCEGGFYSVSCASSSNVTPMDIDRDNLIPVQLMVNQMAVEEPNYVFIRCDSAVNPPPVDLVDECYRLVVEEVGSTH